MRRGDRAAAGFFDRVGLVLYPSDRLYEEMAFLAYYLHWGHDEVMSLDHRERRRWCAELSKINKRLNGTPKNVFEA
ncbi:MULTISPECIES: DUF6760 family protein [Anaerotruncus]|jgi:hypothetical protein|uniref:DUF6760 domain-containing protein n=1 Tax=Anaerotruncus colihominis TaxID=169435 RepID=A0A845SLZ7_9FIRM|nr:DUF6760 family protein [Anaerotruncus colihominis]NDO37869.1 hypothetical protein [Anaerotruncus colihominis]